MDLDHFAQEVARLASLAGAEDHAQVPCRGLLGGCTWCSAIYRAVVGDERPTCMVCSGQHFAYEPHWSADAGATVELGVKLADAQPWRWESDRPVLINLTSDEGDQ